MTSRVVSIGRLRIANDRPLTLIAGPCALESERLLMRVARSLVALCGRMRVPLILKCSYDKANRTSGRSFRGPGFEAARTILARVRQTFRIPLLVDVHTADEAALAAGAADGPPIPAFPSRQTDLLFAAGRAGKPVNVKKGQFVSPWEIRHAVDKIASTGNRQVLLTERGAMFGYQNLVVDMRSLEVMKRTGCPVLLDATHALQMPGAGGDRTGGAREFVPALARAGAAVGIAGLFMEVHPDPARARSDAATQWPLHRLGEMLDDVLRIDRVVKSRVGAGRLTRPGSRRVHP